MQSLRVWCGVYVCVSVCSSMQLYHEKCVVSCNHHHNKDTYLFCHHTTPLCYLLISCGSAGRESTCNEGDLGSIPELGRSPGEGKGYPLQYSGLENSMDCIIHGITKSRTRLNDFHLTHPF